MCWYWTHNSNPFWWFFLRPLVAVSYACMDHILLSIWGRSSTDIQSFLSKQLSTLWYSTLWVLHMLAFPDSQNSYLNSESLLDFTWDLTSFLIAWKQSQGSKVGAIVELIQFVFHFWGITVLHCLVPVSWNLFKCILSICFCCSFKRQDKYSFCYSILAKSKSAKEVLRNCPISRQKLL